jgi:membrane protein DedA with SNARE-associated domain
MDIDSTMIPFQLVLVGTSADQTVAYNTDDIIFFIVVAILVAAFILIYIFRERRKKNK